MPVTRVSVKCGAHTYMYTYQDGDEEHARVVVTEHVTRGRLPPAAGIVLCEMIEGERE